MTGAEAAAVGVPLLIFVAGVIYGGVKLLVKASAYMARSATASESTADSIEKLTGVLTAYMTRNDERVNSQDRRIAVLEDWRSQQDRDRGHS